MAVDNLSPLQIIHSFEGYINGTEGTEVLITPGRKNKLDLANFESRVIEGIDKLKERGIGGLVVNIGYDNYLDDDASWKRFLFSVRAAVERDMRIWLYDENGYPSGSAGGKVLKDNPEYEAIGIKRLIVDNPKYPYSINLPEKRARLYAVYGIDTQGEAAVIEVDENSAIVGDYTSLEIYYIGPLYEGTHAARNISASRRYINLLNADAVNKFLQVTHVKYFEMLPKDLRKNVEAVFTDEPSLMAHIAADRTDDPIQEDLLDPNVPFLASIPWCDDMEIRFFRDNGFELRREIRKIFAGDGSEEKCVRRAFWETVSNIYAQNFARQSAQVCAALGIDQTGHLLGEDNMFMHALFHGDLIKALREFQRPGVDVISCNIEIVKEHYFPAHKYTFSAAFFENKKGLMTEVGDYMEWENELTDEHIRNIKMVLAAQYLLGVRDFALYFRNNSFSTLEYQKITNLIRNMLKCGDGAKYTPDFALYYPIEKLWENFIPSHNYFNRDGIKFRSEAFRMINDTVQNTVHSFIDRNVQFVMCSKDDIANLSRHKIKTLIYPAIGEPDECLKTLCANAGVNIIMECEMDNIIPTDLPEVGEGVLLGKFECFVFAVNYSVKDSFVILNSKSKIVDPFEGQERISAEGKMLLEAGKAIFIF